MGLNRNIEFYNINDEKRFGRDDLSIYVPIIRNLIHSQGLDSNKDIIVELGCGRGALKNISHKYIGIDISFQALKNYLSDKSCLQADIQCLPFKDRSIPFIFSIAALEHLPFPEECLAEIDRVLKPGGIAFLHPAWFCRSWAASGLEIKKYNQLKFKDKIAKVTIPIRNSLLFRGIFIIPQRLFRELRYGFKREPLVFEYKRLNPNLQEYISSDSDAFAAIDPHSLILYFLSRKYQILNVRGLLRRIFFMRHPVIVKKADKNK